MKLKKIIALTLAAIFILSAVLGCDSNSADNQSDSEISVIEPNNQNIERAEQFVMALINGDYATAAESFDETMSEALGVDELKKAWEDMIKVAGESIDYIEVEAEAHDEYDIYNIVSYHENSGINSRIVFSQDNLIAGLFFTFVDIDSSHAGQVVHTDSVTPAEGVDGYSDTPVIIGEGTDYPLNGILSVPDNKNIEKFPAVVLVHGSGPQDMNSTVFGISVFKNIADYLVLNNVAVLRYDKRTLAHGQKFIAEFGDEVTVWEETIEDAILAKELLLQNEQIDPERIYVLGHSLGGMLAPRIVSEGGFAGGIIMAGSPRSLLDIIYDQNMYLIPLMDINDDERDELYKQVEEAREIYFTLPEVYILEMDAHPAADYLLETDKPFLILHGDKDFQVYTEADFNLYKEITSGRSNFEFRLYDNLNHLFTISTMENPTTEDYIAGSSVSYKPLADIVEWLNG
ncbi:MAG: alpha/beta fold hydrolase [Oscillospiraceae bacterium]|nr:alpha/beta fold hydrolase [Oscillospiraceae bacterium]